MRTSEQRARAWQALLLQVEKAPVVLYFRGIDAKDQPLYEVTWKNGLELCKQGTEKSIMQALETSEKE